MEFTKKINSPATEYPHDKCIHQLFEDQVRQTPDAIALVCGTEKLTYKELNQRANKLAHHLQSSGIGPEMLVGICMERSAEMVISLLGILKAGGAYVPLDPANPPERLDFISTDARISVILTQQSLVSAMPKQVGHIICLENEWPETDHWPASNPDSGVQPDNLAYVIYTSGSTGQPKGSLITHYNVVRLFQATEHWFCFDKNDVWTLFHSYAFDFSVWEMWGALIYGGRLIIVSYWMSRSPESFYDLLRSEKVTVLNQTPSAFYQLIRAEERMGAAEDLSLRLIIFGGEALDPKNLRPWFEHHGDKMPRLVNMYGITETTVHVTYYPLKAADAEAGAKSLIGEPIPDLQLHILSQDQKPVPVGMPGELYVGGAGLSRSYLNQPELTSKCFVPDPFTIKPDKRLYKTGDMVRSLSDGNIEYIGRIGSQVKIRGFRIEPGEIESVLSEHPGVRQAVVMAREDVPNDKRLAAYVVPGNIQGSVASELRGFLRKRVPDYMIPSAFVTLEALPLTPNGKLDYDSLPAPGTIMPEPSETYAEPRNSSEKKLAGIWADVLGIGQIGIHDNFFELGGHSLSATRVISRVNESFQVNLSLRSLFDAPTVESLARNIQAIQWVTRDRQTPPNDKERKEIVL